MACSSARAERSTVPALQRTPSGVRVDCFGVQAFRVYTATALQDVVVHYNRVRNLRLTDAQQRDLVEFLKTL